MSLSVAIIAGGKSSRFGSSKALAEFRGRRLIDHAVSLAQQLSDKMFVCCGPSRLPLENSIMQLPDVYRDCGPIGGLHVALESCKTDWLAIMPCDMPLLSAGVYRKLLENCKEKHPVVAISQTGMQPLVSIWPVDFLDHVTASLIAKRHGLQRLLKQLEVLEIGFKEDKWFEKFHNVNTLNDLKEIQNFDPLREMP